MAGVDDTTYQSYYFMSMKPHSFTRLSFRIITFFSASVLSLSLAAAEQGTTLNWPQVLKEVRQKYSDVAHITGASLDSWLSSPTRQAPLLLDARTPDEYNVSHLRGAHRALTKDEALKVLAKAPKNRSIVVYCSVGYRSAKLASQLQKAGFTKVYNLEGGIFAWKNAGRTVYKNDRPTNAVHPYSDEWGALLNP
jgi:rhodanese-related sulfurtransferase